MHLDVLPSQPEPNHSEQCNVNILRGGKLLEGPKEVTNDESLHEKNECVENLEKEMSSPFKVVIDDVTHKPDEVHKVLKIISR